MMLLSLDTERIQYENKFLINFGTVLFSHLTLPLRKGVHLEHGGDRLLSIGEFSKICKVSTKTLRYYDEIGLSTQKTLILKWISEGLSAKSENFLYAAFSKENDIEKATAYINLSQNIIQGYLIYLFLFIHTSKSPQSFFSSSCSINR